MAEVDVVVVGAGNAASVAALTARQQGARVVVLEAAPVALRGGNSAFTGGAYRFTYRDVEDLKALAEMSESELGSIDFGTYTEEQMFDDMARMSQFRCDPDLTALLVRNSYQTALWMKEQGIRFYPAVGRQAFKVDGKFRFWGGLALHINGGGQELVATLHAALERAGVPVLYETPATGLLHDGGAVRGVRVSHQGAAHEIKAKSVVLACGSFESNPEMRARYLGPGWDLAKVRGTRFNQGAGLKMAMDIGAAPYGHWSGSHAVAWDLNAPPYGDITVGDQFQKHNVPFSIMVNAKGERFRDEGSDFHSYTYARYGGEILQQPGMFAWQVFDQQVTHLLRSEYRISRITKVTADTLEALAPQLEGVDPEGFLKTVREFNAAIDQSIPFDPNVKDGRRTNGLAVDKTNWANPLREPPFEAYAVTAGVTFAFGGLKVTQRAQVEDTSGNLIDGLYACGEMVGGLYYHNYASGTGLMAGSVFGRIAGASAAGA
ncbi:MAG: FAD-dependent oxidoreductase [Dehalococcoidia bacterium]|nr:FAD-dependent oxidoreductase [Dehalococcoidia bacterium]